MTGELTARFSRWIAEKASEGLTLEFKSGGLLKAGVADKLGKYEISKAVASLANTEGGTVAVGIKEDRARRGWAVAADVEPAPSDWSPDRTLQFLNDWITPAVPRLNAEVESVEGGTLILIHVPVSFLGHQNRGKEAGPGEYRTRRANGVSEPLDGRDVRQLLMRSQLPDPVIHLFVPEAGQRAGAQGDFLTDISWQLLLATRTALLTTYRVTLLWDGFEAKRPPGFGSAASSPKFGCDGVVSVHQQDHAALFPGVYELLAAVNIRMKLEHPHCFVAALLQVPGVLPRLFAWHIWVPFAFRKVTVQPPEETWWAGVDLRDPLGNPISYERYSGESP